MSGKNAFGQQPKPEYSDAEESPPYITPQDSAAMPSEEVLKNSKNHRQ
jgi:hypothetical protein